METKTILIVEHDHLFRQQLRDLLWQTLPKAKVVEYILGGCVLTDLKWLGVDLLITGERLLDGDGHDLARAARRQMPLLPIITIDRDPFDEPPAGLPTLHQVVAKSRVEDLLPPVILTLLHQFVLT